MTNQPDRCPLCGGEPIEADVYPKFGRVLTQWCANDECRLPCWHWPRVAELMAKADADCEECKRWIAALYRFIDAMGPRQGTSIPEDFEHAMVRLAELTAVRDAVVKWRRAWEADDSERYGAACETLHRLAREELERQEANQCEQGKSPEPS